MRSAVEQRGDLVQVAREHPPRAPRHRAGGAVEERPVKAPRALQREAPAF